MPTAAELLAEMNRRHAGQDASVAAAQQPSADAEARARRRAELLAEMNRERAAWEAAQGQDWRLRAPQSAAQAQTVPAMPPPTPGPQAAPQPVARDAGGTPSYEMDWSYLGDAANWLGDRLGTIPGYLGQTAANIPRSAENVATGLWDAATDPLGTAEGLGKLAVGTGQAINEAVGLPEWARIPGSDLGLGDQRATAAAAGQALADRYGGWEELGATFRDDPAGFGLDLAGLGGGVAGAARLAGRGAPAAAGRAPAPRPETGREFIANAPTTEQLRVQGGRMFDAADKAGVRFPGSDYRRFAEQATTALMREGMDVDLHPRANRVAAIINENIGNNPSLSDMLQLRRKLGAVRGSPEPDERRLGMLATDMLDDFVEGGSTSASGMAKEARRFWSRMRKSEKIENAIRLAESRQSGKEAALRNEFGTLYRAAIRGDRSMKGFSKDEIAAIKRVAEGDFTTNTLRRVAQLGFGTDGQRNVLAALAGIAAGGYAGGGVGAVVAPAAGTLAGHVARRRTSRAADMARAIAARGETPGQPPTRAVDHFIAERQRRRAHPAGLLMGPAAAILADEDPRGWHGP